MQNCQISKNMQPKSMVTAPSRPTAVQAVPDQGLLICEIKHFYTEIHVDHAHKNVTFLCNLIITEGGLFLRCGIWWISTSSCFT